MTEKESQAILPLLLKLEANLDKSRADILRIIKKQAKGKTFYTKTEIIEAYKELAGTNGLKNFNPRFIERVQMKPVRTISGVAPVTVLTKPFPCPGNCIFCPNDLRMPKSYIAEEPGAQRAEKNFFNPYLQTYNRLEALYSMGHPVDKVELIILGGTWTAYPESYQIWFIKECFRAMNEFQEKDDRPAITEKYLDFQKKYQENIKKWEDQPFLSNDAQENRENFADLQIKPEKELGLAYWQVATWAELEEEQIRNENSKHRNVGLVIETRPDEINEATVLKIRHLGATKVQLGVQSLSDDVLEKNKRGHGVETTNKAFALLRQAGFKLHIHWMANLYGSNPKLDKEDFSKLFSDQRFCPDELKIYPCSLIETAELMKYFKKGLWRPYSYAELLDVSVHTLTHTPEYCRITRMIRDIPAQDIVIGNRKSNFRQIAQDKAKSLGLEMKDIRAREIRQQQFDPSKARLEIVEYETTVASEKFLQFVVPVEENGKQVDKILAFLRLSLPNDAQNNFIDELKNTAMIREIHVYGRAQNIGQKSETNAQHLGFGKKLIEKAKEIAQDHGFEELAVISAIGTREYYRKRGFAEPGFYQKIKL
jgi:elongator complex protein 3